MLLKELILIGSAVALLVIGALAFVLRRPSSQPVSMEERLRRDRCVVLRGAIDDEAAALVIAKLLFLESEGSAPVNLLVDSPGGSVSSSLAVLDTIKGLKVPVRTRCKGKAHGTAAIILAAGHRGERVITPGSRVELTPLTIKGDGPDVPQADLDRLMTTLATRLAGFSGRSASSVAQDMAAGLSLSPDGAVEYGLVDRVAAVNGSCG